MSRIPDDFSINGLASGNDLKPVARDRSKKIEVRKVSFDRYNTKYQSEGYDLKKKLKDGQCYITKNKSPWTLFEDRVWSLFYNMGFDELNKKTSKEFTIPRYENHTKQIDVFARNERTICIVECKSTEKPHTPSNSLKYVRDAINEIGSLQQEDLRLYIYKHYHNKTQSHDNYKLVWILALENIDLSDKDKELAKKHNIFILDNATIAYYEQLAKQFSHASKYMFLSQYLDSRKIPGDDVIVPAIRGKMGGYVYYSFSTTPESLLRISFLAHRGNTNLPSIETYQRIAKKKRLENISEYIKSAENDGNGALFPTSIVMNFSLKPKFEEGEKQKEGQSKVGTLYLPNEYNSAWVIDGQHRLYAYSHLEEEAKKSYLPVIAFEELPPEDQAKLFVQINGKQEKVDSTLINEIKATILASSPYAKDRLEAMCSGVVNLLNTNSDYVFYDRIVEANVSKRSPTKNITNQTLIDELGKSHLIGTVIKTNRKEFEHGVLYRGSFKATCEFVATIISDYYRIFLENDNLMSQWNLGRDGFIGANNGIKALLRLLRYIILDVQGDLFKKGCSISGLDTSEIKRRIRPYLDPVIDFLATAPESKLKEMRQLSSEAGVLASSDHFVSLINEKYPEFQKERAADYREKHSQENRQRNTDGKRITDEIETLVKEYVVTQLKEEFGNAISEWWVNGVPEKVRSKIVSKASKNNDYSQEFEPYLTFDDLFDIVYYDKSEIFEGRFILGKKESSKKKMYKWLKDCGELQTRCSIEDGEIISEEELNYLHEVSEKVKVNLDE